MKNKFLLILTVLVTSLVTPLSFANTYVKCGLEASFEKAPDVVGYELELSSEGEDDYSGPVGDKWNMKLGSEDSEWLGNTSQVTARNYLKDGDTIVEITIVIGTSVGGPVGTRYVLTSLYDDEPKLEKFTMGGFAGTILIDTYQCFTGND